MVQTILVLRQWIRAVFMAAIIAPSVPVLLASFAATGVCHCQFETARVSCNNWPKRKAIPDRFNVYWEQAVLNENGDGSDKQSDFLLWKYLDHTRYMIFRLREKELAQLGLTPEQAYVLDILHAARGSTTINRIVEATQRQHNSISTLITRMARQGLVRKTRTRRDKRAYRIALTEKGRALFNTIPQDSITKAFLCLTAGEKNDLLRYLDHLLVSAYQSAGHEWDPHLLDDDNQGPPRH